MSLRMEEVSGGTYRPGLQLTIDRLLGGMRDELAPVVEAQMLIRRPVDEVFEAFVDPDVTTRFWFTRSSGRLAPGAVIQWEWEMYGVSTRVKVLAVETGRRILIEWDDPPCFVEWLFDARSDEKTLVRISNWGFHGSRNEVVNQAIDAMGGFTMVLAGAKALLEHGVALNLIGDHRPGAHQARSA